MEVPMICQTPSKFFLVSGSSEGYSKLNSFDGALLNAGIGNTNLVKMSSIIPPKCEEIKPVELPYGALVPVAYSYITSDLQGEVIAASIAVALPENEDKPGLIMEYSARGRKEDIEKIVRQMAIEGMKMRNEKIKTLKSISVEHSVEKIATAFAAAVLWF
jgi:arginine decarboxylase